MHTENLRLTSLNALHKSAGAKMVPFAGYEMPVQYPAGVLKEHLHTREAAGLFDVSHMGQIRVTGPNIALELEKLMPQDVLGLPLNRQRYGLLCNEQGGILDDLMFTNCGESFLLVVNAACKEQDFAWLRANLPGEIGLEMLDDRALLAIQGPRARAVLTAINKAAGEMRFMDVKTLKIAGIDCLVSCSGYTGEDGYEISVAAEDAQQLAEALLTNPEVALVGLGARDSLRLEAGLCLYGHDMDESKTAVEANLLWAISKVRRPDGERAGGYIGADAVARQLKEGVVAKRVLLDVESKAPVREGTLIVDSEGREKGRVCSGGFGPSVGSPIAIAYIEESALQRSTPLYASLRGKQLPVTPRQKPFVQQRYFRG
ncbi:MAG: glycine cleavage system aminomethyltransferase GcvT [Spongiibacteraceae bacterium]